jgi:Holliday junction resolvase RusA-like endonuclease
MTPAKLRELFPNASEQFIERNSDPIRKPPATKLERRSRNGSLAKAKTQTGDSRKFLVRVTSYRIRLLDEDNLCEKYHVDCCRYAGIISDDSAAKARIETSQQKVKTKGEERTEIQISRII